MDSLRGHDRRADETPTRRPDDGDRPGHEISSDSDPIAITPPSAIAAWMIKPASRIPVFSPDVMNTWLDRVSRVLMNWVPMRRRRATARPDVPTDRAAAGGDARARQQRRRSADSCPIHDAKRLKRSASSPTAGLALGPTAQLDTIADPLDRGDGDLRCARRYSASAIFRAACSSAPCATTTRSAAHCLQRPYLDRVPGSFPGRRWPPSSENTLAEPHEI